MRIKEIERGIYLIDAAPDIPGFEELLGVYVIRSEKTALVDVGPESAQETLSTVLAELNIKPEEVDYIMSTHVHLDHTGGIGTALKNLPNARAIVHEKGKQHLVRPEKLWEGSLQVLDKVARAYRQPKPADEARIIEAQEGMIIDLGGFQFETLLTPGHASHHLSFVDRERGKLFSGEAAGVYFPDTDISRPASPPPFDLRQSLLSVNKMLAAHPKDIYYSHFGHSPNAVFRLQKIKEQMVFWGRVISKHLDNPDVDRIGEEIMTLDNTREAVYRQSPEKLDASLFFMRNNILGYLGFLKREGPGVMDEMALL